MISIFTSLEVLKKHLYEFLNKIHWNTLYNLEVEEVYSLRHLLEAFVDMKTWIIHFKFPPKFLDMFQKLLRIDGYSTYVEKPHLLDSQTLSILKKNYPLSSSIHILLHDLLAGLALHEYGHSTVCPIHKDNFSVLVQAVSTALEQEDKFNPKILNYILNQFTDTIVNTCFGLESDKAFYRNGFFMFYYSELLLYNTDDLAFYFYILLNSKLFQFHTPIRHKLEDMIIINMPSNYAVRLKKLLNLFCPISEISEKMWNGIKLTDDERWMIISHLSDAIEWGELAYSFTKFMLDLLPDTIFLDQQPIPDSIFTKRFKENSQFKSEVMEKILKRKLEKSPSHSLPLKGQIQQNPIKFRNYGNLNTNNKPEKKRQKPLINKSQNKYENYSREKYPGEFDLTKGFASIDYIQYLDMLYRYRTKQLQIKTPKIKEENLLPIGWLNRQILTEHDNLLDFDPLMVYYLPGSDNILFYKKSLPITDINYGTARNEGFPNIALFCDDSGSMDWDPINGTGKYDAVLIMIYSLLYWLKTHNFAASIQYNITNFSSTTRSSGWIDYFHLNEIFPLIFNPEQKSTELNIKIFRQIINHPKKKIIIIITDGEIINSEKIKDELKRNRTNIHFLFVQIGKMSSLASKLKSLGFSIVQVKNISKLPVIVLDFIKKSYS